MYLWIEDIPEATVADELAFECWPEDQQRLAQRVLQKGCYGKFPIFGGSTLERPVLSSKP